MEITNEFYDALVEEVDAGLLEDFFMADIRRFLADKMHAVLGKMLSSDPLSEEEFLKILNKGLEDDAFKRQLLLSRIHDFSASCKIKNASNKWVVDYFYLSCLKQLIIGKKVERVKKNKEFADHIARTVARIDSWLEKMTIPVEKKFFLLRTKTEEAKDGIDVIKAGELYPDVLDLTQNVFIIYHSLAAGLEKERDNVDYEYELVADEMDFADIAPVEKRDAVKAAKIQKDQTAVNLFENLIALYYLKLCR